MIEHMLPVHAFLRFLAWSAVALAFAIAFVWLHVKSRKASVHSTGALLRRGSNWAAVACVLCAVIALAGCQKFDPKDGAELWFGINVGALFVLALVFALGGIFMLHKEMAALRMLLIGLFALGCFALLTACGDTINPVRYQVQEVLITKPCLAGRTPPAQAVLLTDPVCTLTPAECVRAAAADIAELQREARESRNLIRECSK